MLVGLSVCPSICPYICNKFFSKSVHQFSEILHIDENLETGKMTEVDFAENSLFPLKSAIRVQNRVLWSFHKILSLLFAGSSPKLKILQFSVSLYKPLLRKNLLQKLQAKIRGKSASQVICQNALIQSNCKISLIVNASGRDTWIQLTFCIKIVTKGRQHLRFAFEWLYPVIPSYAQTCLDLPRIPFGQFWGHCQIESSSE